MNHDELAVDNNELKNIIVLAFKHLSDHSFDEHIQMSMKNEMKLKINF